MTHELPGDNLDMDKMPGHWALAQIGKRVLRPGGLELTRRMLSALAIGPTDHVVEFAPGLGITAKMALAVRPASYTAVERDRAAAAEVSSYLSGPDQRCVVGTAERSGLEDACATVVYGEAMLTMQPLKQKREIVSEAARLLKPGGRYAIHEISLIPEDIPPAAVAEIENNLAQSIRAGVRPLRKSEWHDLLASAGLVPQDESSNDFSLLEPKRLVQDEGIRGALRIGWNVLRNGAARRRVLAMRHAIGKHAEHMRAIMLFAVKQDP
ncbi:MAG: class I SAM-dependent methyltransferase [Planctomycetota bacterium]